MNQTPDKKTPRPGEAAPHRAVPVGDAVDAPTRTTDVIEAPTRETGVIPDGASGSDTPASGHTGYSTLQKLQERRAKKDTAGNTVMSIVKATTYIVLVTVAGILLSLFFISAGNDVFALVKEDKPVEVTIPAGATTSDVAGVLYDSGVIKYKEVFVLYASLRHDSGEFLSGAFTVSTAMDYDDLRAAFKPQISDETVRITIPEGATTDEIIDLFVSYGIGTREGFVKEINEGEFDYWFVEELDNGGMRKARFYRLDGYLYPDTYEFYVASSEHTVINKLLKRFGQIFKEEWRERTKKLGYTTDELITLASIVEKEAYFAADVPRIASVFTNRLNNKKNYPKLQSDATIAYAMQHELGRRPGADEIEVNYPSPYNTYLYDGLPPGPISNPGLQSINNALYPSKTNFYYFVSYPSGYTLYATTLQEHNANVAKVKAGIADDDE
ncbi:MAG: endolytic transglycosylase MltG [Clostridia bacterium]|nr:endolytic transglycosylase MltG [Clostridia bacterium]